MSQVAEFAVKVSLRRVRVASGDLLPLPRYATSGSSGFDLCADIGAPVILQTGDRALVPTGIAIAVPLGFEGQVRPRSGIALRRGVTVLNSPGTVDADYRGEVQVILINHGRDAFEIQRGDCIAQLVVVPVVQVTWCEAVTLPPTERGGGGFGSTGR